MRHGSLFAALRGKDGRSLAWALIALVLMSVFVGGLGSGIAATGGTALCLIDDAAGKTPMPAHLHKHDCCIVGSPFSTGVAAPPPTLRLPTPALLSLVWAEAEAATPGALAGGATARGPPLKA